MICLSQKDQISPYLKDASQFSGEAEAVFLPESEEEVSEMLKEASSKKTPVTVSGGRTGLTGAAVPGGGWILSIERLSRVREIHKDPKGLDSWARLEPALHLKDIQRALDPYRLFYPPDPTGPKALLGGTVATNASGPNSFKYGATRRYIRRIRMVLADGEILDLRRGQIRANHEGFLEISAGSNRLKIPLPHYSMPGVKHASGYFIAPGMDAVDLFIGSEGTLGVTTEIEVGLLPKPDWVLAFVVFFRSEEEAWRLVDNVKGGAYGPTPLQPRILEYFDGGSLDFLRPRNPSIPKEARACLFVEQESDAKSKVQFLESWHRFFEEEGTLGEIWEGETAEKQEQFRSFRSALPLAIRDFLVEHDQMKVGTDTCVPRDRFKELMLFHRHAVEKLGIPNVTFGHIGESHVHLNLLARNPSEAEKARALYPKLVQRAMELGGTFSAEHGVGKLKRRYLLQFYGEKAVQEMAAVKRIFDPHLILCPGNIFEIQ